MQVFSLTYASSAVRPFSRAELVTLLEVSRANNEAAGVTGMLLYKGGNFMQVLEGNKDAVLEIKARIDRDPRHRGILLLLSQAQAERNFGQWSMAFRDLDGTDVRNTPGYDEFLNTPLNDPRFAHDPAACQKLLMVFKRSM